MKFGYVCQARGKRQLLKCKAIEKNIKRKVSRSKSFKI